MDQNLAKSHIAVVIPCYNEGAVIATTVQPLLESGYSVVVVNDGSSDNSRAALHQLPVYALSHATNLGQGAALQTGVEFALSLPQVQVIVHFDADGQHSHQEIEAMIEPILADHRRSAGLSLSQFSPLKCSPQKGRIYRKLQWASNNRACYCQLPLSSCHRSQ